MGHIKSWARPFGGGQPVELKPGFWELDDFQQRFASSAIDVLRPFDPDAKPTHWIFVDLDEWNALIEASIEPELRGLRRTPVASFDQVAKQPTEPEPLPSLATPVASDNERLLRLPEVMHRTGLSRQTIYRRMKLVTFPHSQTLSGNITVWRESEVAAWIASPR